jgi:hypothetical protein
MRRTSGKPGVRGNGLLAGERLITGSPVFIAALAAVSDV